VKLKILFILTYYRPHVSGLTIYVERLAKALAGRGHQITVLTSHYARGLPSEEHFDGVRIVRVPVAFRFSKGVFMPTFPLVVRREIVRHDVVNVHLPQVEATLGTLFARLAGHKPILTYHCDLQMPPVWYGWAVDRITVLNNLAACSLVTAIVTNTEDFARHSQVLKRFGLVSEGTGKVRAAIPPIVIAEPSPGGPQAFRAQLGLVEGQPMVGFVGRFAHEKGVDYLINAIPRVLAAISDVRFVFAGPQDAVGETTWHDLQPLIEQYREHLTFLGTLPAASMPDFFAACDVVTVPSINNTESFGMVQAEAFMCGTPVVATDLPGVRQPVAMSGMGEVVPVADVQGLASGIVNVLKRREQYIRPRDEIMRLFGLIHTVDAYERLFLELRR
jgi:glycosyltransferase involved in cell wall biosynthesis